MLKKRTHLLILALLVFSGGFAVSEYILPHFRQPPQAKPAPIIEEKKYDYYILIDQDSGAELGTVSSVRVTTGDEYISENNKRYVVTRVEENRAFLQSFGPADGNKDKGKFKDKTPK